MSEGTVATPELSRTVKLRQVMAEPIAIAASAQERTALAKRFRIEALHALDATINLEVNGPEVRAKGRLEARIEQLCAVSGAPFETLITEPLDMIFVPEKAHGATTEDDPLEVDFDMSGADEIEYRGDAIDVGEAVAQTLALAIDPYAEGPGADAAREAAGIETDDAPSGPMAELLKGLKKE